MDYDDNDFQSQNLHLAGEGNTKFPPVLRPYALPKFDFDESLQGHLRFDSLVETEVLLGIESNEDNQWIDSFSRGSSGIEFNSTAAESCTISRHNNVWSEATSSESVEMLLKSVGQEELIPRQVVIEESGACNELACLNKKMESNPKPEDKNAFEGDVTDLQPTDCVHENLSELKENVGREQSQVVSQDHEGEFSLDGSSSNQEHNNTFRNIDLPVSEGSLFTDGKSNESNEEVGTAKDSLDDRSRDLSASGVQANISAASVQNTSCTCDVLNIQNVENHVVGVGDVQQGHFPTKIDKQDIESSTLNKEAHLDSQNSDGNAVGSDAHNLDKSHCSVSTNQALDGGRVVEGLDVGINNREEAVSVVSGTNLQKAERCSEGISSRNPDKDGAKADTVMDDQSALSPCDLPKVSIKGDSSSEGQVVEISDSNGAICPDQQQDVDTVKKNTYGECNAIKEKELVNIDNPMDTQILASKSEEPIFTVEGNNVSSKSGGNSGNQVGDHYSLASSSTKSCIMDGSTQTCKNNEVDKQGDHKKLIHDAYENDQTNTKLLSDSSLIHCVIDQSHFIDKEVDSSSLSVGSKEHESTTSTILVDLTAANDSASKVILANTSLMSCKTVDVPSPSNIFSIHQVIDHSEVQRNTAPVVSTPVDEKQESTKIAEEVGASTPVRSTERETSCSVNGTDKYLSFDKSTNLVGEAVNNCLQVEGTNGTENIGEPQGKQVDKGFQEGVKVSVVSPVPCRSTVEQGGDKVRVSFDKRDMEIVSESHEKLSSKLSGDILLASQGSVPSGPLPDSPVALHEIGGCPANITCSSSVTVGSSSQTEKDGNPVKASADQNPPVSEVINRDATNVFSIGSDTKGNNASKDESNLTSCVNPVVALPKTDVVDLTTKVAGKRKSLPTTMAGKASSVEGSPSTYILGPTETKTAGDIAQRTSASKGTSDRKARRTYNKTPRKESSRKRSLAKETALAKQPEKGDKSSNVSMSPSPNSQLVQSSQMQQYGYIDSSNTKTVAFLNVSTSGLPDLNTSASPPVLFQQPFTDLQQVQLRAQIFVYGALIQGTAPDEASMISAFGGPDGGRSIWEKAWRACMERQHGKKSQSNNPETPQQSGPVKQSSLQGKAVSSPLGRASSNTATAVISPLMPLSSPLWSVPTHDSLQSSVLARGSFVDYTQALTSLHPYQTPPLRNFLGHSTSWISQAPLHGPWVASPTPAPGNSSHISASPASDTMKFNSVKGSPLPPSSGIKNAIPSIPSSSGGSHSIFVGTAPLLDTNVTISPAQRASDPKPRKRKKVLISEDLGQKALQPLSQLQLTSAVSSPMSTVSIKTAVGNVPQSTVEKSVMSLSSLTSSEHLKSDRMVEKKILSDESLIKIKEARGHAEDAAALSNAAVNHSLEIWNQLDKHKSSGLVSDVEAKLASAAVAVAAAAAVAKAAAAAANVASNAALQAKLMADEALMSSGCENPCQSNELSEGVNKLGKATPASILKGANGTNSSVIVAAKEASRRRVEAASAASKRAENVDAIVKAAELAAEAVSLAGKIVTMGDPLSLSDLVEEASPEGCWRVVLESTQQVSLLNEMTRGLVNSGNAGCSPETSHTMNKDVSSDELGKQIAPNEKPPLHKVYNERSKDHMRSVDGISNSPKNNGKNMRRPKGRKVSDLVNPIDVVPESDTQVQIGNGSDKLEENIIKEGSLVEVLRDGKELKAAWFIASVLTLKDGNAYVCYTDLVADKGAGPLKEWVTFEGQGDRPPRIRYARPLPSLHYERSRKRRRAAMGDYAWSVGDRVDAWIQESWREGVVMENKKDDTFAVYFPAHGETSMARAWQIRPSLIWRDGKWTECSRVGPNDSYTHEGDTPHEKRLKLGGPPVDAKGKDKMSKSTDAMESVNPNESRFFEMDRFEKMFHIGKYSRNENKPDTQRTVRTGLQKEGSRVIFGVPKPGKKRKFMEVSKHYVADGSSNNISDGNDSNKVPSSVNPQVWKKIMKNDSKEKRGANPKNKTIKSGKTPSILGRGIPPKNNISANASQSNDLTDQTERSKDSASHFKNASDSENQLETASYSSVEEAAEGPILFSSLAATNDAPSSNKTSTSRASKGKLALAGGNLGKIEEEKPLNGNPAQLTSEAIEPRRSNRRILPTSRLLEGLQSSLIMSKFPPFSHDKSQKTQNRSASRGNDQG